MAAETTTTEIIASALRLPIAERTQILDAIEDSLIDSSLDHGPSDPAGDVAAAWQEELAHRIAEVDGHRVQTIPSEQAWKMIDGEAPPKR